MTAPQPSPASTSPTPASPTSVLIDLVTAFFMPMFLPAANGDIALARMAAVQTMNAYRIRHQADLMAVAQVVAFGFATLSSLSLSMEDDLSLSMILRLRGNANACHRSGERSRQALQAGHQAVQPAPDQSAPVQSAPTQSASTGSAPAAPGLQARPPVDAAQASAAPLTPDGQRRAAWAAAFTEVAAEFTAEMPGLSPAEQKIASMRVAALNSSASALLADAGEPASTPCRQGSAAPPQGI